MSISIGVPTVGSLSVDALGIHATAATGVGLNGVSGPVLSNPDAQTASRPVLPAAGPPPLTGSQASLGISTSGLDPLTPRGFTTVGTAALSAVIGSVVSTLQSIHASPAQSGSGASPGLSQLSQLVQSSGFQLLFHVLSASDASPQPAASLSSLLANSSAAGSSAAAPNPQQTNLPVSLSGGGISSANGDQYFQKLLGELESAYKTTEASGRQPTAFNQSELDLFLKWLSLNGSSSVAATA